MTRDSNWQGELPLEVEQTKGGNQMPRGKKDLAEQITPELRGVEIEVGFGSTSQSGSITSRRRTLS